MMPYEATSTHHAVHLKRALLLQVVMYDCFRPGDIVRAKVLSLGDARSYHLSTADNSLGVVRAKSLAGAQQGQIPAAAGLPTLCQIPDAGIC
jgi:exosome complex RNA-binding protein Csl4